MALQVIEGFDHMSSTDLMDSKQWDYQPDLSAQSFAIAGFAAGRVLGKCFHVNNGADFGSYTWTMARTLPSTYTSFVTGFAFQMSHVPQLGGTASIFGFWTAAGALVLDVRVASDNSLRLFNGSGSQIATSSPAVLTARGWHYIELKVTINGASGSVAAQVDGASAIGTTTVNIGSTAIEFAGPWTTFSSGSNWDQSIEVDLYYDDWYFADQTAGIVADFIGDVRVETIYPNAAGTHNDWTPNSGVNHYDRVNEHTTAPYPDDDITYLSTSTVNNEDTWNYDNLSIVTGTIYGVQTNVYARKEDPLLRQVRALVLSGATLTESGNHTLATSYTDNTDMWEKNPTGSVQWTVTTVNSAEFGVKLQT